MPVAELDTIVESVEAIRSLKNVTFSSSFLNRFEMVVQVKYTTHTENEEVTGSWITSIIIDSTTIEFYPGTDQTNWAMVGEVMSELVAEQAGFCGTDNEDHVKTINSIVDELIRPIEQWLDENAINREG